MMNVLWLRTMIKDINSLRRMWRGLKALLLLLTLRHIIIIILPQAQLFFGGAAFSGEKQQTNFNR